VIGRRWSDSYQAGDGATFTVKRSEGGYDIKKGERLYARILHDQTILDREGKPWGKITNEFENVMGPNDLVELVGGLYHWSDLLK
jgi:hypothetical protein